MKPIVVALHLGLFCRGAFAFAFAHAARVTADSVNPCSFFLACHSIVYRCPVNLGGFGGCVRFGRFGRFGWFGGCGGCGAGSGFLVIHRTVQLIVQGRGSSDGGSYDVGGGGSDRGLFDGNGTGPGGGGSGPWGYCTRRLPLEQRVSIVLTV